MRRGSQIELAALGLIFIVLVPMQVFAQNERGKSLYEKWCAHCHGMGGDGKGSVAELLDPKPLDFTHGFFKFKSTPTGQVASDEDLFRTITQGLPGTAMPAWGHLLSEEDRRQVIAYIKTLSERFKGTGPPPPIPLGKEPPMTAESIAKGREIFHKKAQPPCTLCHGENGRGNGPAAAVLPVRPRNLTQPWLYRGGFTTQDIFLRVSIGIERTPMPGFANQLTEEERWQVAHYVRSLQEERWLGSSLNGERVQQLPSSPEDPEWDEADFLDIPLAGQIIVEPRMFNPRVDSVRVRALYTDMDIAVLLEWDDPWPNTGEGTPPDGAGIQFPVKLSGGIAKPHFGMGDTQNPVYIWAWWANNKEAKEYNARGPKQESIIRQPQSDVVVQSLYKDGRYRIAFTRSLITEGEDDLQFETGKSTPFALMAYDGSNGEEHGRKAISAWYYVTLVPPRPMSVYVAPPLVGLLLLVTELLIARVARGKKI